MRVRQKQEFILLKEWQISHTALSTKRVTQSQSKLLSLNTRQALESILPSRRLLCCFILAWQEKCCYKKNSVKALLK